MSTWNPTDEELRAIEDGSPRWMQGLASECYRRFAQAVWEASPGPEAVAIVEKDIVAWRCFDCGSCGPFRSVRKGNPIEGDYLECECGKCGSANTGERSDMETEQEATIDTLRDRVAELEALLEPLRTSFSVLRERWMMLKAWCRRDTQIPDSVLESVERAHPMPAALGGEEGA